MIALVLWAIHRDNEYSYPTCIVHTYHFITKLIKINKIWVVAVNKLLVVTLPVVYPCGIEGITNTVVPHALYTCSHSKPVHTYQCFITQQLSTSTKSWTCLLFVTQFLSWLDSFCLLHEWPKANFFVPVVYSLVGKHCVIHYGVEFRKDLGTLEVLLLRNFGRAGLGKWAFLVKSHFRPFFNFNTNITKIEVRKRWRIIAATPHATKMSNPFDVPA